MPPVPVVVGIGRPFSVGRVITEPVYPANPAAGAGFTYTAKGRYWERLVSGSFKLVTDGNAAGRIVTVSFQNADGRVLGQVASPFTQAATKTAQYTFAPGIQQFGANDAASIGFATPDIILQPGWKIVVGIAAVQVTDALTLISLLFDRFPTGPEGYRQGAYVVDEPADVIAESV